MRGAFGILGLLLVLALVGLLAKKQMTPSAASRLAPPGLVLPGATGIDAAPVTPAANVQAQTQEIQQQYKQALEAAMQQSRPEPDDK